MITITDAQGNAISWSSAGMMGFKGSRKSTPYAAQVAADDAGKKAAEHGVRTLEVEVKGPGSGRESALRGAAGGGLHHHFDPRRDADPAQRRAAVQASPRLIEPAARAMRSGSQPAIRIGRGAPALRGRCRQRNTFRGSPCPSI